MFASGPFPCPRPSPPAPNLATMRAGVRARLLNGPAGHAGEGSRDTAAQEVITGERRWKAQRRVKMQRQEMSNEENYAFDVAGYLHVPGVLSREEVVVLNRALDAAEQAEGMLGWPAPDRELF